MILVAALFCSFWSLRVRFVRGRGEGEREKGREFLYHLINSHLSKHSLRYPRLRLPSRLFVEMWNAHFNMLLITAQPIRNLRTPASADMNKRGFLEQASPLPLPNPPPLFPFLPIPYPLPLPLSTPATQARLPVLFGLKTRREKHNHRQVCQELSWWTSPSYLWDYFQQQTYDVHVYCTRSTDKYLLIKSIPNQLREPSFIRALPILMILYNFIPVSHIVFVYRIHVDSSFYNWNGHPVKIC